jgi:hypothetical protein
VVDWIKGLPPRVRTKVRKLRISWMLARWAARHQTAQVVQIGAHTASIGDPLQPLVNRYTGWRVLFVEPIPAYFDELVLRRGGDARFQFVRAAITDHDGEVEMTTVVQGPDVPPWTNQLSSIHRETVLWHEQYVPGLRDAILARGPTKRRSGSRSNRTPLPTVTRREGR